MRVLLLAAVVVQSASPVPVPYRCLDDTRFTLIASPDFAIIRFPRPRVSTAQK